MGESASEWLSRNPSLVRLCVFEPVPGFAEAIREKVADQRLCLHSAGIAQKAEQRWFKLQGDASFSLGVGRKSIGNQAVRVAFDSVDDLVNHLPSGADFVEINIEGGEYELLDVLSQSGFLGRISTVLFQFHRVGSTTKNRVRSTRAELSKTHFLSWQYPMVWECWRMKPLSG